MNPGDEIADRYRLEELAGRGPMSEVWRAHDRTLDRTVALKLLSPAADLDRFRREARAVAALAHENVMRLYDYGEDAAGPFMALEWLHGGTLEDRLERGVLPAAEATGIARGIAAGLAHLHARGLVHRDLKPANVLFDEEGRPKLGDFGLARNAAGAGALTDAGTVLGTAAYISPEQAGGEPATPASDVYSFGVLLFLMLTGALPFVANDALELLDMHRNQPAPPVASLAPQAPPELAALADASLRKDPAARPADGAALLAGLGLAPADAALAAADTMETRVLPVVAEEAPPPGPRRGALAIGFAVVLLAALGATLAWAVSRTDSGTPVHVASTHGKTHGHSTSLPTTSLGSTTSGSTATTGTTANTTTAHTSTAHTTTARTTTTQPTTTQPTTTAPTTTTTPTTTTGATTTGVATTT